MREITIEVVSPKALNLSKNNKKSAQKNSWAELEKLLLNIKSALETWEYQLPKSNGV
jgi:hypothetical protein